MTERFSPFRGRRPRFSIAQRLVLGYAAMGFFTLAALVLSLLGLLSLNRTARDIAHTDVAVVGSLAKLRSAVLAQEGYAGRYAIFKSPEFETLFREREKESLSLLALLEGRGSPQEGALLGARYRDYSKGAADLFAGAGGDPSAVRAKALRVIDAIDALSRQRQSRLQMKLIEADQKQRFTIRWTVLISVSGFLLAVVVAAISTLRISSALKKLQRATHRIAQGEFDHDPQIPAGDEIGDLAADFVGMAQRLKELERANLDASPLTRLPGNIAIDRELEKRLESGKSFAFCYADLDNFKAYSDCYGYSKGSELIRLTGDLICQTTRELMGESGFVGHIGGDDFVMVLPEEGATGVCEAVIAALDAEIPRHYRPEDCAAGGIAGVDRYGVKRFFPMVSVSIAVVVCGPGAFSSAVELARVTSELKDMVKEEKGSNYSVARYGQVS